MFRISTVLIVFLGLQAMGYGEIIRGKIFDKKSNDPVVNATVKLKKTFHKSFSKKDGGFFIDGIKPGSYEIVVKRSGFIPQTMKITVEEGKELTLDFPMLEDRLFQHEVIVSATKTNHTVGDVPVSAQVVTGGEIEKRAITNIQDLFTDIPGINIRRDPNSWGRRGTISIQGLDPQHTLVLVNGQKYVGGLGGTDVSAIPVNLIEKVEVVKGPSSVLYGSDAMGGVVNIITKSPFDTRSSLSGGYSYGSDDNRALTISGNYNMQKLAAGFNFTNKHADGYREGMDDVDEYALGGNLSYKFNPFLKMGLETNYQKQEFKNEKRDQKRFKIASDIKWSNNEGSALSLRTSYFRYRNERKEGKTSDWKDHTLELELTGSHLLFDNHLITGGYRVNYDKRDDAGKKFEADQTMHSFYLQDEISAGKFTFVPGVRLDKHDRWGSEFNPKLNVMFKATDDLKFRASVGRAFRAPTLVSLYAPEWKMGRSTIVNSNPDLKPETSMGYQLGMEVNLSATVQTGVSVFKNDIENLITTVSEVISGKMKRMTYENVAEAMTRGLEVFVKAGITKDLMLNGSWTWLKGEDKTKDKPLYNRPKHHIVTGLTFDIPSADLNISFNSRYVGKRLAVKSISMRKKIDVELDPYVTADLAISKRLFDVCRAWIRVDNIFDKKDVMDEYTFDGIKVYGGIEFTIK